MTDKNRTGMFYVKLKQPNSENKDSDVVVMDKGVEIARYPSVEAFVAKHREGLYAIGRLEENMEQAIESHYTLYPKDPSA
jgi:hypothetical protein